MPQRTRLHTCRNTLLPLYHYCALPFISPLLRVTGSKIWFPPHNSLHNAISPALNCQDNLYQSGGESPEWSSSYFSGRQVQTRMGGEGHHFHTGKATDSSATSARLWWLRRLRGGKTDRERFHLVTGRTLWASKCSLQIRLFCMNLRWPHLQKLVYCHLADLYSGQFWHFFFCGCELGQGWICSRSPARFLRTSR